MKLELEPKPPLVLESNEPTDDQKYAAILSKDHSFDDKFITGVLTTGVFCKPSCSARPPLQNNIRFFITAEEALAAGLRPCMKCRPTAENPQSPHTALMRKLCRYIRNHADESLTLEHLAELVHLSPAHFQRVFKECIGISPKEFTEACRLQLLKGLLRKEAPAAQAIIAAGFGSSSRIYEKVDSRLGMTPKQYSRGGQGLAISFAFTE